MFADLRSFIEQLRRDRDLVEVSAPVDPNLEAAEIHRRVIAAGGPALLFTNVKGGGFPLVTNLFGTARRAELAFGTRSAISDPPEPYMREMVTKDVRLDRLPVITCWPEDGGPFVTFPLVYTQHPDKPGSVGASNLGMYRMQVNDRASTGMHWQIGKGGGFHYAIAEGRNERLPVTVFLGGPPALILSAIAPLPENVPELMLASLITGDRLQLTAGVDNLFDRAYSEHLNLGGNSAFGYPADPVRINEPGRTAWLKLNVSY